MPVRGFRLVLFGAQLVLLILLAPVAHAGGGPFGIDYRLGKGDTSGIFNRGAQTGLEYGSVAFVALGALVLGNDNELGHTFWQSADSAVFAGLSAQVLKYAFSRARPNQGNNPNAWFQGHGDQSFPSGEETLQASWVTPFILDYYHDHPWIWALELLPIYDGYARMKSQAHWQSDIIAGWLLGSGFGYWAAHRRVPLLVEILPDGVSVGFYKRF
jgi:membrane-associated phospholipid phosphatase